MLKTYTNPITLERTLVTSNTIIYAVCVYCQNAKDKYFVRALEKNQIKKVECDPQGRQKRYWILDQANSKLFNNDGQLNTDEIYDAGDIFKLLKSKKCTVSSRFKHDFEANSSISELEFESLGIDVINYWNSVSTLENFWNLPAYVREAIEDNANVILLTHLSGINLVEIIKMDLEIRNQLLINIKSVSKLMKLGISFNKLLKLDSALREMAFENYQDLHLVINCLGISLKDFLDLKSEFCMLLLNNAINLYKLLVLSNVPPKCILEISLDRLTMILENTDEIYELLKQKILKFQQLSKFSLADLEVVLNKPNSRDYQKIISKKDSCRCSIF